MSNPVHDAIMSRRSVRKFLNKDVPEDALRRILEGAGMAPSGHNTQPWQVHVVKGATKQRITDKALASAQGQENSLKASDPEFEYYPTEWFEPYLSRRRATGFGLYEVLGIGREDKQRRNDQMMRNFKFFDAPVGMFITFSRRLNEGTFMDIGMFIENILIGARGEGLHTCGQVAWCNFHGIIREELGIDDDQMMACGISLGYEDTDAPENTLRVEKVPLDEWTTFHD